MLGKRGRGRVNFRCISVLSRDGRNTLTHSMLQRTGYALAVWSSKKVWSIVLTMVQSWAKFCSCSLQKMFYLQKLLRKLNKKKRHELCLTEKKEAKILFFFKTEPENKFKVIRGNLKLSNLGQIIFLVLIIASDWTRQLWSYSNKIVNLFNRVERE